MKTFFVNAPANIEIKNWMLGDFYKLAKERPDARLVVFVEPKKVAQYQKSFAHERCIIEPLPDTASNRSRVKKIFRITALSSIPAETIWIRQKYAYLDGGSLLALWAKRIIWLLGHMRFWREFLRLAEYHLFRDDQIWERYFDKYRPNAVFAVSIILEEDVTLAKQARRRGIPVLGMARSWDNLTSKLFLHIKPDLFLVQNKHMVKEAVNFCDMPQNKVLVAGFPQWDFYLNPACHISKEETAKIIGADPKKRWITLFTGGLSTANFRIKGYGDHIDMIGRALERGELGNSALIAKFHPLDELPEIKKRDDVSILNFGKDFDFSHNDVQLLINLLRWADVVVVFGSTISLEAMIFDKPVVLAAFDGYKEQPYQKNLSVALSHTTHYVELQKTGGMRRVANEKELIGAIKEYLDDPRLDAEGRKKIKEEFLGPLDGGAGRRALEALLSLGN